MDTEQKKHRTSTAAKNRYNSKVYAQIAYKLPKELVASFKEKCDKEGIPQAQIIRKAIEDFLNQK